jgi:hypothetical protein
MTVSKTSAEPVSFDTAISQAQKNISEAIGFIQNSSLNVSNIDFQDLLNSIQERIKKIKSVKLIDAENLSFEKTEGDRYKLLVPRTIANQNSFLVYRSLLSYFLEKIKQNSPERFNKYELNDLTNTLSIKTPGKEATNKIETPAISFDEMVLQVLHDGPGPRPASELPPLVDNSYVDLTGGQKPNFDLKIVARLTGIYPDEKNNMVYWRPFADELNRAVTSNRKEEITKILTNVLNAFLFILTRTPQPKLPRNNEEGQGDYNKRVIKKIETDFLKFIIKYINIRESGNQSLRPLFIQAINGIREEELDSPLADINFSDVLDKFRRASISAEEAEIDQASLLAIEDRGLANAPRIAQSSTMGAARLGITDQSQGAGHRRSAVALIGGAQSISSTEKKDSLIVDNNFYVVSDVYDFKFANLKEGIVKSLESAIRANASDLKSFLPAEIDRYLDSALERTSDPEIISPMKNEAKELLKIFADMLNSRELKELLSKNKIQLSPQQFFLSQIFLKYFAQDSEKRKDFYLPILRELENQYAEFNGLTALINEAKDQSTRVAQKGQRQETGILVERIINIRKSAREGIISSLAKNPGDPVLKVLQSFQTISAEEIKKHIQTQGISNFIERLAMYDMVLQSKKLVIDNNLEEYKLDFIELITGIKPLNTLNTGGQILGTKIPVLIGHEGRLIEKKDLIDLVKNIITRRLMSVVHADKKGEELTKLLPGVDNIPELASELYEFLNSRQDLLDIGTAWSDQESSKIERISQSVSHAVKQAQKYQEDQTVQISKEREQKLEAAANTSINAQAEIKKLQTQVDTLRDTLLEVLKMLAAQNRPSREELERLSFRIRDQSGQETFVGSSLTETRMG